jgi:hypothetical protein
VYGRLPRASTNSGLGCARAQRRGRSLAGRRSQLRSRKCPSTAGGGCAMAPDPWWAPGWGRRCWGTWGELGFQGAARGL